MQITQSSIMEVAFTLGKASNAKKVILFGSHASGLARGGSDVDFLVIAESPLPRYKRSRFLYSLFHPYPFPMDILVYTPNEIEEGLRDSTSFVATVLSEGKEVYVG